MLDTMSLFSRHEISEHDKNLKKFLKNILGVKPGNILLYKTALIHKSCSHKDDKGHRINNERLEYLGDAVLSTIIGDYLFKRYPHQGEGFLTEMRSKLVSRVSLNALSKKIGLSELIEYHKINGTQFLSIDGDAFEALTGAIFLDLGYKKTYNIIINRVFTAHVDFESLEDKQWNYKSKIIDWGQKNKHTISYEVLNTSKDTYRKQYRVQILIDSVAQDDAVDYSIKAAEQLASEKAYKKLVEQGVIDTKTTK